MDQTPNCHNCGKPANPSYPEPDSNGMSWVLCHWCHEKRKAAVQPTTWPPPASVDEILY